MVEITRELARNILNGSKKTISGNDAIALLAALGFTDVTEENKVLAAAAGVSMGDTMRVMRSPSMGNKEVAISKSNTPSSSICVQVTRAISYMDTEIDKLPSMQNTRKPPSGMNGWQSNWGIDF